jgi:hypothetical protein
MPSIYLATQTEIDCGTTFTLGSTPFNSWIKGFSIYINQLGQAEQILLTGSESF